MNVVKIILVLLIGAVGYRYWAIHRVPHGQGAESAVEQHERGFVWLPPGDGISRTGVTIFSAEGCPEEAAQRADRLAEDLGRKGIPVTRSSHYHMEIPGNDSAIAQSVQSVMNGEQPIVLVRGWGRANPSLADVVAEYGARTSSPR